MQQEQGNLSLRTTNALKWSLISHLVEQLLQLIILVFLARLLDPKDFGLVGIITIFTNFAFLLSDLGFGAALIQRKDIGEHHLDAVFSLNIMIGLLLTVLFVCISPLIAAFYDEPSLKFITSITALGFVIASLSNANIALLRREMNFKRIAIIQIASLAGSGIASILLAFWGCGVWCLVFQSLIFQSIRTGVTWISSHPKPHFKINGDARKDLFGYGLNLTGFNVFNYWVRNADNFLVGKIIGPHALGIYSKAYTSMTLPILQITDVVSRVMFPALSSIQTDVSKVKMMYLKVIRCIALVTCPIALGLLAIARPFVLVVLGDKWVEVIPVLQILCIIGVIQGVSSSMGLLFTSLGRTDLMLRWGIFSGITYIVAFLIGIKWGILGVSIAYVVNGYLVLWYPAWTIPGKLVNLSFLDMLKNTLGAIVCSIIMALGVWLLATALPPFLPLAFSLAMQIIFGGVLYITLIHVLQLKGYQEMRAFLGYSLAEILS
ncbi:MAG: Teichuronic acid biosynthesis protein TuaB [Syntrophorhabdus sp. PtaB.Bin006]|nr:MAG: Teichuronic acid biosynthesis protein TuaB [Syntrophorhabdus sp. PtaB.Bin006]